MAKDAKGRLHPGFERHVFICSHSRDVGNPRGCCAGKNSLQVMKTLKLMSKEAGLSNVRVQKAGCLDFCENGISCVVYPEATWYSLDGSLEQLKLIMEQHLRDGKVVEEYLMDLSTD